MTSNVLLDFFREGGLIFMLPLLALSVLSLAIMLERAWFLGLQAQRFRRFAQRCEQAADRTALASCWKAPARGIAGTICGEAASAVEKFGGSLTFEQAICRSADKYTPLLAKRLWMLHAWGIYVVVGLAMAFRGLAEAGLSQQNVAKGIAVALNTTIMGLTIALPTLFAEHTLRAWAQSLFRRIGSFLDEITLRAGAPNR